jgi:hypothetical protein
VMDLFVSLEELYSGNFVEVMLSLKSKEEKWFLNIDFTFFR